MKESPSQNTPIPPNLLASQIHSEVRYAYMPEGGESRPIPEEFLEAPKVSPKPEEPDLRTESSENNPNLPEISPHDPLTHELDEEKRERILKGPRTPDSSSQLDLDRSIIGDDPIAQALAERRRQKSEIPSTGPEFKESPEKAGVDYIGLTEDRIDRVERREQFREREMWRAYERARDLLALPEADQYDSLVTVTDEHGNQIELPEITYRFMRFEDLLNETIANSAETDRVKAVRSILEAKRKAQTPVDISPRLELDRARPFSHYMDAYDGRNKARDQIAAIKEELNMIDPADLEARSPYLRRIGGLDQRIAQFEAIINEFPPEQIALYIKEAKQHGEPPYIDEKRINRAFTELMIALRINDPKEPYRKRQALEAVQELLEGAAESDRALAERDDDLSKLSGIVRFYYQRAYHHFQRLYRTGGRMEDLHPLDGQFIEGEFNPRDININFREKINYSEQPQGYYYRVYATTPEEFRIAARSFIESVRGRSFGNKVQEIFNKFNLFKEAFNNRVEEVRMSLDEEERDAFASRMARERHKLEAEIFQYADNYSVNYYEGEGSAQAKEAMGGDNEAKARWLSLADDEMLMAALELLDTDPRAKIRFRQHGTRGEAIGADHVQIAMGEYFSTPDLIKRLMRLQLKDYLPSSDPTTEYSNPYETDETVKQEALNQNRKRLGNHQSSKDFWDYYEGYSADNQSRILPDGTIHIDENSKFWVDEKFVEYTRQVRQKEATGEPLTTYEKRVLMLAEDKAPDRVTALRLGILEKTAEEKAFYAREYTKARNSLNFALEIYNANGEMAVRSGAAFIIEREITVGNETKKISEIMPVPSARNFVQFMVTHTKKKYGDAWREANRRAHDPALTPEQRQAAAAERKSIFLNQNAAVQKTIRAATTILFEQGFSAIPKDAETMDYETIDGRQVAIVGTGENIEIADKDQNGNIIMRDARFNDVLRHFYGMRPHITYPGTQEEIRHELLSDEILAGRDRLLNGESLPEDEDPLSVQAAIMDPGRNILRKLRPREGYRLSHRADQQPAENLLVEGAIEGAYQDQHIIDTYLYRSIFSREESGFDWQNLKVYYGPQDYNGAWMREATEYKGKIAWTRHLNARRGMRLIWALPLSYSSLPVQMGARGFREFFGLLSRKNEETHKYYSETFGNFSLLRYAMQTKVMDRIMKTLTGFPDLQNFVLVEGFMEKILNSSWNLQKWWNKLPWNADHPTRQAPEDEVGFTHGVLETFGRLDLFNKALILFEHFRKSRAALDFRRGIKVQTEQGSEYQELWIDFDQGRVNPALFRDINTGSSRHFWDRLFPIFINHIRSPKPGGGEHDYPDEVFAYDQLENPLSLQRLIGKHASKLIDRIRTHMGR